jgi:hypothetical protein
VGPDGSGALNARVGAGFEVGLVKTIDYRRAMPTVRRLAAILAADVAGYSRLMGADEEGTHERLKATKPARWAITSSAIRPASRPTRAGSRLTVP